jgi:hypothetical protein
MINALNLTAMQPFHSTIHLVTEGVLNIPRIFTLQISETMIRKVVLLASLVLGICVFPASIAAQDDQPENISVTITNETTRMQLHEIRLDLGPKGLDFQYQPEFNADLVLTGISIKVKTTDGLSGAYETSTLGNGQEIKIIRNYETDAEMPFCVGLCDD